MSFDHDSVVYFAKTFGLFYLIALSIAACVYAYWPSRRRTFEAAAETILTQEDRPWRS